MPSNACTFIPTSNTNEPLDIENCNSQHKQDIECNKRLEVIGFTVHFASTSILIRIPDSSSSIATPIYKTCKQVLQAVAS